MVYICTKCGFSFNLVGEVETCSSCEEPDVRKATENEAKEFPGNSPEKIGDLHE